MDLVVRARDAAAPGAQPVEVVERKGLGHPDTICDALAEEVCVRLCAHYLERFGVILHHNVDKLLLCGGSSRPRLGGGEVIEPIEIYVAGRATGQYRGEQVHVDAIATEACRDWLRANLPMLEARHVKIAARIRGGSAELTRLFARGQATTPLSNDTSCGVGFAPLTDLEHVVLEVERTLNGAEIKRTHPAIGADIKVMGVRRGARIHLTIGCALVDRFVDSTDDYVRQRAFAEAVALDTARRLTDLEVHAVVNAADHIERGDLFLTVTGTSAEAGDDGEVGRGNRTSGLITPYRPMALEAAAGKNPVNHVGKLYNLAAGRIADTTSRRLGGVDVSCVLVSQIGRPIDDPQVVDVRLALEPPRRVGEVSGLVEEIVRGELAGFQELRDALLARRVLVL
jgi:S-adenosylmethionine synthetase